MERTKHKIILILMLIIYGLKLNASYRSEVYSAYVNNKMELWKNVLDRMNAIPDKSNELILELVNYQYGYIGYCLGYDKKNEARVYLELAQKNIDYLEKQKFRLATVNAYNSAFCGFRIGINPISAAYNGFRSVGFAEKAIELENENYLGYVQFGNIQFYMPKSMGGSKKEGIGYFIKARKILEKNTDDTTENWNYLAVLILIGQSYYYLNDYASAKGIYEYILKLEPGFIYVRDELYPQLLNKMKES
jgi:tetratricopeptide (TPR) repeat protein